MAMRRPRLEETIELDGRKLRAKRKAARLTQERLASLASPISRSYLSNVETQSTAQVSQELAERLASALGTSVSDLLPSPVDLTSSLPTVYASAISSASPRILVELMAVAEEHLERATDALRQTRALLDELFRQEQ